MSKELERIRWRCRRGMLELDLLLERFIVQKYAGLDESAKQAFDTVLDLPDSELWDMIRGVKAAPAGTQSLLEAIQQS